MRKPSFRRYHYQVYFPKNTPDMCLEFFSQLKNEINPTYHAVHQLVDDPKGIIDLPSKEDLLNPQNILVEFYEQKDDKGNPLGKIQKMLIRVKHLSEDRDFSYILAREGFIVSAWSNEKNDNHRLTNNNNYFTPGEQNGKDISIDTK